MSNFNDPFDCVVCHRNLDGISGIDDPGATPKEGDITICVYCATPYTFRDGLAVYLLPEEIEAMDRVDKVRLQILVESVKKIKETYEHK